MTDWIDELIDSQESGYSLSQPFYTCPEVFERDVKRVLMRQWQYVDHVSALPNPGDYLLFNTGGESVIVVRNKNDELHAFFNVCRHRGSIVCLNNAGNTSRLSCPYHGWTWDLDGNLIGAPNMPDGFDKSEYPLFQPQLEVVKGMIFIKLDSEGGCDFSEIRNAMTPFLNLHGIGNAKVAHAEDYEIAANWKLVLENFSECYHCLINHPEYSSVNALVKKYGNGSPQAVQEYDDLVTEWSAETLAAGYPVGAARVPEDLSDLDNPVAANYCSVSRFPIGKGMKTQSQNGLPVAPLMGEFEDYDGGETSMTFSVFSFALGCNDYTTVLRFTPRSALITDMRISWLVNGDAAEGEDYEIEKLKWHWHITNTQDKRIIENNQIGVNSRMYAPGPYSKLENLTDRFVRWYLHELKQT